MYLSKPEKELKSKQPSLRITWTLAEQKSYYWGYTEEATSDLVRGAEI